MHLHFDLISGIAGDMTVAALLDLGVPLQVVEDTLALLPVKGYRLEVKRADVGMAMTALKFDVLLDDPPQPDGPGAAEAAAPSSAPLPSFSLTPAARPRHLVGLFNEHGRLHDHGAPGRDHDHGHDHSHGHEHGHEHAHAQAHDQGHAQGHDHGHAHDHGPGGGSWAAIRAMLEAAPLPAPVREMSLAIFERIAVAEARVHGMAVEEVAFHEVGAVDSIVDIVAVAACVHHLSPTRITASPVPLGRGFTWSQHGRIPLPAPATMLILEGIPVVSSGLDKELVTPTGAGILAALVDEFVELPSIIPASIGHGAGTRRLPDRPNVVRAIFGAPHGQPVAVEGPLIESHDQVIEANIDDMSGELCGHVAALLLDCGALDVWWTPILMKKGRPAHMLSVLCDGDHLDALVDVILRETTSLGVRIVPTRRLKARRKIVEVETIYGVVLAKLGLRGEEVINAAPEYESARAAAMRAGVPLKLVLAAVAGALKDIPPSI